jgi:hypothetical protein
MIKAHETTEINHKKKGKMVVNKKDLNKYLKDDNFSLIKEKSEKK